MSRNKSSVVEDLIVISSKLPWWLGLFLATASYLVLHHYARSPTAPVATDLAQFGAGIQNLLITSACYFIQYLIPPTFLIGAGISAWKASRSKSLLVSAKTSIQSNDRLSSFTWREFETLVGQAFRERGYTVKELGGNGPDGGVDLELRMGSDKYYVQCKHWKTMAVGVAPVRELFGVMSAEGAVGGFVVASGPFTPDAAKFTEGRSIELINAAELVSGIKASRILPVSPVTTTPTCRRCGTPMLMRESRKGTNAGSSFWGCRNYPSCREIRPS